MKKLIHIGTLVQIGKKQSKQGQIIFYRSGKTLHMQNLDVTGLKIEKDFENDELILKLPLRDGDFVVIQDEPGVADKKEI